MKKSTAGQFASRARLSVGSDAGALGALLMCTIPYTLEMKEIIATQHIPSRVFRKGDRPSRRNDPLNLRFETTFSNLKYKYKWLYLKVTGYTPLAYN